MALLETSVRDVLRAECPQSARQAMSGPGALAHGVEDGRGPRPGQLAGPGTDSESVRPVWT